MLYDSTHRVLHQFKQHVVKMGRDILRAGTYKWHASTAYKENTYNVNITDQVGATLLQPKSLRGTGVRGVRSPETQTSLRRECSRRATRQKFGCT